MNIYQRINEVRKEVQYIKKDASVQNYMAVSHDMVTAKIRDSLIKHGIVVLTDQIRGESREAGATKSGAPIIRYEGFYEMIFINMDEPSDRCSVKIESHALDYGDKAPGKSLSYAVKSQFLKVFNLETGLNDESRLDDERKGKLVAEHLKEEMQEYIDSGDSLALMLFSRKIGPDMWSDLYNSAPEGKKVAFKKKVDSQCAIGQEILEAINQAILSDDDLKAKENVSDLTEGGKKLLANFIGREKAVKLGELTKT